MVKIDLQFNFTSVPPELVASIQTAIQEGKPFGLTNGRVLNVFHPVKLMGWFSGSGRTFLSPPTLFKYENVQRLTDAVSMALLSCKEFISCDRLPYHEKVKSLDVQKMLE